MANENENEEQQEFLEKFDEELNDAPEVEGKVYRIIQPDGAGRETRECVGKVFELVDDDYLGRKFGGGLYVVRYKITLSSGKIERRDKRYRISATYNQKTESVQTNGDSFAMLSGILGGLSVEKIAVFSAAVEAMKKIFAPPPPPPQIDVVKLLDVLTRNQQAAAPSPVSDQIALKALEQMNKPPKVPTLAEQMKQFKEVQEMFNQTPQVVEGEEEEGDEGEEEEGDDMEFIIKQALKLFPAFLEKNGGDYAKAGAAAAANPVISNIIGSDPELLAKFKAVAAEQYGAENAEALAKGFGI
jgi:hypothetical protein